MRILTSRLRIELTFQNEMIRIYAYPHKKGLAGTHAMIPIYYDASNIEADVDIFEIIAKCIDEKKLWDQYLTATGSFDEDVYIENYISPFSVPTMGQHFMYDCCIIEMAVSKEDLLNKGYLEEAVLKDALEYHGCISILTAIAFETLKYSRLAVEYMEPVEA